MPLEVAKAVCKQQLSLPATNFHSRYLYCSADLSKQHWQSSLSFVPLPRMTPLVGLCAAEDLIANVLVNGYWARLDLSDDSNLLRDDILKGLRAFVKESTQAYEADPDTLLQRVRDHMALAVPSLQTGKDKKGTDDSDAKEGA